MEDFITNNEELVNDVVAEDNVTDSTAEESTDLVTSTDNLYEIPVDLYSEEEKTEKSGLLKACTIGGGIFTLIIGGVVYGVKKVNKYIKTGEEPKKPIWAAAVAFEKKRRANAEAKKQQKKDDALEHVDGEIVNNPQK